jgi:hypothetical protein
VQNPDRTLVNAPTARSRQAVCRGPLIRLPDAAIGVRRLRAAAQAARGALRGPCCVRLSACGRSRWSGCEVADTRQCAAGALTWQLAPRLTAQLTSNRHGPVTGTPSAVPTDRLSGPQTCVSFGALVYRLRHHGSAHRGVHGDTSRAIVLLPSRGHDGGRVAAPVRAPLAARPLGSAQRMCRELRDSTLPGRHPAFWITERCGRLSPRSANDAFTEARDAAGFPKNWICIRCAIPTSPTSPSSTIRSASSKTRLVTATPPQRRSTATCPMNTGIGWCAPP